MPLPGNRSSVVWVNKPREAERLMALSDEALSDAAEKQSHSILGRVQVEPGRHTFPLAIEQPAQLAKNRIVLVGEAAHVVPPIGAQGLNLGLRDAGDIADVVRECRHEWRGYRGSAGAGAVRADTPQRYFSRTFAIDMANRSLLSDLLPMQVIRAAGMHAMGSIGLAPPCDARGPVAIVAQELRELVFRRMVERLRETHRSHVR